MPRSTSRTTPEFRAWLAALRTDAGMTQDELAAAIGASRRDMNRWESAGIAPAAPTLLKILEATGHKVEPHPSGPPGAINAAIAELRAEVSVLRAELAAARDGAAPSGDAEGGVSGGAERAEQLRRAKAGQPRTRSKGR